MCERDTAIRTIDKRPHKEGNDIGDSKSDLSKIEAKRPDNEGCSEGHYPIGVRDSEGDTSE